MIGCDVLKDGCPCGILYWGQITLHFIFDWLREDCWSKTVENESTAYANLLWTRLPLGSITSRCSGRSFPWVGGTFGKTGPEKPAEIELCVRKVALLNTGYTPF